MPVLEYYRDVTQEALASAQRTATTESGVLQRKFDGRGIAITLDVTAVQAVTPGQIDAVNVQIPIGAGWKTIYTFDTLGINTAPTQHAFLVYPGAASAGSWTKAPMQGTVPHRFRLQVVHGNANQIAYAVNFIEML